MSFDRLLKDFDRVAEAPAAVDRLRALVIALGVRGDLTKHDPPQVFEDARARHKAIQDGMNALLATRPRYRWTPEAEPDLGTLQTREGWLQVRLGDIGVYINGLAFKPSDWGHTGRPIIRIQNLSGVSADYNYTERNVELDTLISKGDLLVSWSATLDTFIWNGPEGVLNQHIFKVIPNAAAVKSEFLYWLLKHEVQVLAEGQHAHGLAMMHINRGPFLTHRVLLPPLAEQQPIVVKIEELMALCDELEGAQADRERRRDRLAVSTTRLLGAEAEGSRTSLARSLRVIPRIAVRPDQISAIKQAILHQAVRGNLVPQDPRDEPARLLLGDREKRPSLADVPWTLPEGWAWSTYRDLGKQIGGGTPSKANKAFWVGTIPWVSPKDMKADHIFDAVDHISESALATTSVRFIPEGALLMVVRGMILAHSFPVAITMCQVTINQDMKAIVPFEQKMAPFLLLASKGLKHQVLRLVERSTHGTCRLPSEALFTLHVPVPPLAEQRRIVDKVDELTAVCDELERSLTAVQTDRARLLEGVLHEALAESGLAPERTLVGAR